MDDIKFDTSKSIEERLDAVEAAFSSIKTAIDAVEGRLDATEKTVLGMSDALKTAAPDSIVGIGDEIAAIKTKVNGFYSEVYGHATPNLPFPAPPPSTD